MRRGPAAIAFAIALAGGCAAFSPGAGVGRLAATTARSPPSALPSSTSGDDAGEVERLRQTASKLREEALEAEKALEGSRGTDAAVASYVKPAEYTSVGDSCWEITYRFANEPEPKDDDDSKKNDPPRKFCSGKLQLQFRDDGYTDILSSDEPKGDSGNSASFRKVWGWDLETSEQDSLDYILFSADIVLPPPISTSERFYFQARVGREDKNKDAISLRDGSVTVKRDIEAPTGGWWGIFRGADGILAQFRQVGEFRCKPIADPQLS